MDRCGYKRGHEIDMCIKKDLLHAQNILSSLKAHFMLGVGLKAGLYSEDLGH